MFVVRLINCPDAGSRWYQTREAADLWGMRSGFEFQITEVVLDTTAMIAAVRKHALDHYEDGGWDVIYEAWDDSNLLDFIKENMLTTPEHVITALQPLVDVWADRQADARVNGAEESF